MTIQALTAKQLRPHFDLSAEQLNPAPSWQALQPKLAQSLDYFLAQTKPYLVIQAADFIDAEQVLNQLVIDQGSQLYIYLFDPMQSHCPQAFRLDNLDSSSLKQGLDNFFTTADYASLAELSLPENLSTHLIDLRHYLTENTTLSWQTLVHIEAQNELLQSIEPWDRGHLFGELSPSKNLPNLASMRLGEVAKAKSGLLLIEAKHILLNYPLWLELKHWVKLQQLSWRPSLRKGNTAPPQTIASPLKVIVWGDPYSLASLYEADESLRSQIALELELDAELANSIPHQQAYIAELNHQLKNTGLPLIPNTLYGYFLQLACRYSDHQHYFNLNMHPSIKLWTFACHQHDAIPSIEQLQTCQQQLGQHTNLQQQYSDQAFAEQQTKMWVDGEVVGQINGLSVIDFNGVGQSFGEPIRITATIHQGDGDLADVERKSELAGNIHAKSMMIIQGYLSSHFAHEHHFPLSGTVVFEQSYHEIDGDSASLAGALAMLSALAKQPIKQSLSVTGAIDQQGNVLAVGGVNEKITGFFRLCQLKGLNSQQGVIIPSANKLQLNLPQELVSAVEQGQFHIYAVDHVRQAIPLILGIEPGNIEQQDSLFGKIYNTLLPNEEPNLLHYFVAWLKDLVK